MTKGTNRADAIRQRKWLEVITLAAGFPRGPMHGTDHYGRALIRMMMSFRLRMEADPRGLHREVFDEMKAGPVSRPRALAQSLDDSRAKA
jgi:hypothetical protein